MKKVDMYIHKKYAKSDRYFPFEELVSILGENKVICPYCGGEIVKEDWDNVDSFEPECLYCGKTLC